MRSIHVVRDFAFRQRILDTKTSSESAVTNCTFCNQRGATVQCDKCHQQFHYQPCARACWEKHEAQRLQNVGVEKDGVSSALRTYIPDALTWPRFVCPSTPCIRTLRHKQVSCLYVIKILDIHTLIV